MILITGAAGKTGKAILSTLTRRGVNVRAFVRSQKQFMEMQQIGVSEIVIGDLRDQKSLVSALQGVKKVYYICPNIAPDELEIGQNLLNLAKSSGVTRFVYHSVLHPQVEAMPHHWQKMRMEEKIFSSGIEFTILQPCAYMQNILQNWQSILTSGVYSVPYATSARISIVDLEDVAEVASNVLTQLNHRNAIYELSGPQALSLDEVAEILTTEVQKPIIAKSIDRNAWSLKAKADEMSPYQRDVLIRMFEYYENFGLKGNPFILNTLLGRPAINFSSFVKRQMERTLRVSPIL